MTSSNGGKHPNRRRAKHAPRDHKPFQPRTTAPTDPADQKAEAAALIDAALGELRLRYVPVEPSPKQEFFLLLDCLEAFFGGAAGPGKALDVDVPIPTPGGWTSMREIQEGDTVLSPNGEPVRVMSAGPVQLGRPCVEMVFSDGERIVCDEQHEWPTLTYLERSAAARRTPEYRTARNAQRSSRASGRKSAKFTASLTKRNRARTYELLDPPTVTAREAAVIETSLEHNGRANHAIPVSAPLRLPVADLPIDPYTLGAWLGDGTSRYGVITNDPQDDQIIREIPYRTFRSERQPMVVRVENLTTMIREAGVYRDKHVPDVYLRASMEQRLALLQGLMDTDGGVDRRDGQAAIELTRWRLVEGLCELLSTLGIRFRIHERQAILNGRVIGPSWRINFKTGLPVFRLQRKLDLQGRGPFRRWHDHRYIVDVRRVETQPVRCIEVEGGLYLAGRRMVPTHNSWALLMAALQYADVPGYHALLLRPALTEFERPGGLIEVSHQWLGGTKAFWNGTQRRWTFPSQATLSFGYLGNMADLAAYTGTNFAFVGFDELTHFTERLYRSMFRLLRNAPEGVPPRMRGASNPGGPGHEFVKGRFIEKETRAKGAVFVGARITDNPDPAWVAEYLKSLAEMHPLDRQRLIDGDWDVSEEGGKFRREDFQLIDASEAGKPLRAIRYWDLAGSEPSENYPDPDYTAGVKLEVDAQGFFTVRHVVHVRKQDADVERAVRQAAEEDGRIVPVYVEQDPGQAGKSQLSHYKRNVLQGFVVHAGNTRINGVNAAKEVRSRPWAAAVANELVRVVRADWTQEFLDEHALFPRGSHDDMVDSAAGGHRFLTQKGGRTSVSRAKGQIPGVGIGRSSALGAVR